MTTKRPVLGVSTLVRLDGRVLLVKRARQPLRGYWSLPGGHVEGGETLAEAAAREVREETGVTIDGLRQIDLIEVVDRDTGGGIANHFVLVVFAARYHSGTATAGDDAAETRWVAPAEFAGLQMTEEARRVIASHADKGWDVHA
jgi:8-oxo-dGTP diphosphatase